MRTLGAMLAVLLASSALHAREKLDVIVMKNGDRITGEIKKLEYGRVSIKTDYMSTVQIEWPDIATIDSPQGFTIEDIFGGYFYGAISTNDKGVVTVAFDGGEKHELDILQIARLSPNERTFFDRLNGSFSVGFDYAKSSDIATLGGSFNTTYRGETVVWNFGAEMNSTKDPVQGTLDRDNVNFSYRWLRPNGRFWSGLSSFERNEETGIEARVTLGAGYGSYLLQSSKAEFAAVGGLGATKEWSTGVEDSRTSLEGILGADWRIFDFSTPKVSLTARGVLYPSITESGRYRSNASVSLRREIVSDLDLDLSFYHTYDTDPPDVTAEKSDYGVTTSLGYSF